MRFTNTLVLAALGVAAHPSGHGHHHQHREVDAAVDKRNTWVVATINGDVVSWTANYGDVATSTPTPSSSASSASATPTGDSTYDSDGTGSGISTYEAFPSCSLTSAKIKRATESEISYSGNTGCDGYGSNMKLIKSNLKSDYSYVVKAVNNGSETMQCYAWNKIGPDGGINGFFLGNQALEFDVDADSYQYIAFDTNTQGGMCCAQGSVSTTTYGEFLCPWLEFDFGDAANSYWSGFDASALVAGSVGGPYDYLKACTEDNSVCSTLYEGGGGSNAYLPGDESADGIGGNLSPGDVSLVAEW